METNEPTPTTEAAESDATVAARRKPRKLVVALTALAILLCVLAAAFFAYASDSYHDLDAHHRNLVSTETLPVQQGDNHLAFGDPNAAVGVRADFPDVGAWWVGGHSLGGSMAAQYAVDHAGDGTLDGLVLLGSYSASDLSSTNLGAISLYGSNDQVLNRAKLEDNADLLPKGAETVEIEGGNHAGFGAYGPQSGDGEASITPAEQQSQTADAIDRYIRARYAEPSLAAAA